MHHPSSKVVHCIKTQAVITTSFQRCPLPWAQRPFTCILQPNPKKSMLTLSVLINSALTTKIHQKFCVNVFISGADIGSGIVCFFIRSLGYNSFRWTCQEKCSRETPTGALFHDTKIVPKKKNASKYVLGCVLLFLGDFFTAPLCLCR